MDGDGREPIEVELTSHAPEPPPGARSRWRRDAASAGEPTDPDPDAAPTRSRPDRVRLVATAAGVGLSALAVGVLVGRSTVDDTAAEVAPTTTRATTTTVPLPFETLPIDGEAIGGADFDDEQATDDTSTSVPRRTTTTIEVAGPTVEPVGVDDRLSGTPVHLVGTELGGVLVEADLATGTLTDFEVPRLVSDGSPLVIGHDWVLAGETGRTRVVRSDGSTTTIDLGERWSTLHLPGTELFWRVSFEVDGPGPEASLVGLDGAPVGPTMTLPVNTWPFVVDPATGGVIIANAPGLFVVTPDGAERLAAGELIAVGRDVVVTYDCDDGFACGLYRTDRATGARTPVPPDPQLDEPARWESVYGFGESAPSAISPDGRWVAVVGASWRSTSFGIVELATGRFVELARDSFPPTVAWSPDGRWAFFLDDQEVLAHDTVTGERFPVFTDQVRWLQLGVRPLVPDTDALPGAVGTGPVEE